MSSPSPRTSPKTRRALRHRVGAAAVVVVLPLGLAACGSDDEPSASPSTSDVRVEAVDEVKKGLDGLLDAKAVSFEVSLDDTEGNLKKNVETDAEAAAVADTIIGGSLRLTLDPSGDTSLRDLSDLAGVAESGDVEAALKAVNVSFAVEADGGDLAEIRFVDGAIYAKADLAKIDGIATKAGEDSFADDVDRFAAGGSPFSAAIKDVQAGKWLKLDVVPFASQLEGLAEQLGGGASSSASPSASPSVDGQKLLDDLVQAVLPATTATGEDGEYDVEVKAKQALTAAAGVLERSGIPGFEQIPLSDVQSIPDTGVLRGSVKTNDGVLEEIRFDLESINTVVPVDEKSDLPLTGSFAVVTVDDAVGEVAVPDEVSGVDLNAIVSRFFTQFLSGFGAGASVPS